MNLRDHSTTSAAPAWAVILFCGLFWGALEATGGWAMHALHVQGVGWVMLPVALLSMGAAVWATRRASSAMWVAAVAAVSKLADLFVLSGAPVFWVANPAFYILLEGVAMAAACRAVMLVRRRRVPARKPK